MRSWKDLFLDGFLVLQEVCQTSAKTRFKAGSGNLSGQLLGGSASRAVPVEALSRGARILDEFRHVVWHARALASRGRRI